MQPKGISQYHGPISKCPICTNADPAKPMDCKNCFSRGFVAQCLLCGGKGQVTIPVAGVEVGTMNSTCSACGGRGVFGVKRPADWEEPVPVEDEKKVLATA